MHTLSIAFAYFILFFSVVAFDRYLAILIERHMERRAVPKGDSGFRIPEQGNLRLET